MVDGTSAIPDSKVHGANMGPIWGWQDPGGPHVGPMSFAIWDVKATAGVMDPTPNGSFMEYKL